MVRVADLRPYPNNPRQHPQTQIAALVRNIAQFGIVRPILIDGGVGVVSGQAVLEASRRLGYEEIPAVRAAHLGEADLRAYLIADNRIAELAEWDEARLAAEFEFLASVDFDLDLTGFETVDIDLIVAGQAETEYDPRSDDVPEVEEIAISRRGDLWWLGRHRLLCGDATDPAAFAALMDGARAEMAFSDPPFNCRIDGNVCGSGKIRHREFVMASGEMTDAEYARFLFACLTNMADHTVDGSIHFVCMDWRQLEIALAAGRRAYTALKNLCVWNKTNAGMGTFYRSQHELVLVYKSGTAPHINNFGLGERRYRTNVWTYPGVNTLARGRRDDLALHPTVKPVAMVADAIKDCSKRGGRILDPFAGSGTLFLACAQTGRIGFGMELDPLYVDVALRRWERFTGKAARHAVTGLTLSETAARRIDDGAEARRRKGLATPGRRS